MNAVLKEVPISSAVTKFLEAPKKLLINGKWISAASGKTFEVKNPATGRTIAHAAEGDKADIDAAVQAARHAFDAGTPVEYDPQVEARCGLVQPGLLQFCDP